MDHSDVQLYIYDLSKGMARNFSAQLLGVELPGIWHTSIIVFGREYFYGSMGITSVNVGETMLGEPDQIVQLGKTELPYSLFLEYISSLSDSTFRPSAYNLFGHNCNNFSNELSLFLTGKEIPKEILELPNDVLNSPIGPVIRLFLESFNLSPPGVGVNFGQSLSSSNDSTQLRNQKSILNNERISNDNINFTKNSSEERVSSNCESKDAVMSEAEAEVTTNTTSENQTNDVPEDDVEEEKVERKPIAPRKVYKYDDPPIVFKDANGVDALKKLIDLVSDLLSPEQQQLLKELNEYLTTESGAWALGNEHLDLIAHLLSGGDGKFAPNVPLLVIEVLQAAALKDDFVLILHQDRKEHQLMSYINKIESLTLAEQEEIAKLMCNLCSQPSTFDWLLYISEWIEDGMPTNNARVTTRAAVHTVLNDKLTTLQKTGCSLIFNIALKELFDDTATELATAVLQFLHSDLQEEQVFLCLTSVLRFMAISYNDVPALVKMLGPDLSKFKGLSERVDSLIEQINAKLSSSLSAYE